MPDKLIPFEIQLNLKTDFVAKRIVYYETIGSTMESAFELGLQGAQEGTVVYAEAQTNGKGRLGRAWSSPKQKGIYLSVLLRPKLRPGDAAKFTFLSSVAVCEAINNVCGLDAQIKWPNDILINQGKVAGILIELNAEAESVKFIVIGIGINVNTNIKNLPINATSLKNETGKQVSRIKLAREILSNLEKWYVVWKQEGFVPIIKRWKELSVTLGKEVRISDFGKSVEGTAVDIDEHGGLMIRNGSGIIVKKMTGDVEMISQER